MYHEESSENYHEKVTKGLQLKIVHYGRRIFMVLNIIFGVIREKRTVIPHTGSNILLWQRFDLPREYFYYPIYPFSITKKLAIVSSNYFTFAPIDIIHDS